MPTPAFAPLGGGSQEEIIDSLERMRKNLEWLLTSLDTLNIKELNADVVNTGTLNANLVKIRSDLGAGYLQIDGTGIRANNGYYNTFEVDYLGNAVFRGNVTSEATVTGALIRTAASGRRIEMASNQLSVFNSNGYPRIQIKEFPQFDYHELWFLDSSGGQSGAISGNGGQMNITAASGRRMVLGDNVWFGSNASIYFQASNYVSGLSTSYQPDHNHGIAPGTRLALDGGGAVTWEASGGHSHSVGT